MSVTRQELTYAFERYAKALEESGVSTKGLILTEGSKAYGVSFKAVYVDPETGGHYPAPGTEFGGYLGMTKSEAVKALDFMTRLMWSLIQLRSE